MTAPYLIKANEWATNDYFDQEDRQEIKDLIRVGDHAELEERFYQELEFGTGGLRNIIGFGSNRINKYTIRKAAQAMANIICTEFPAASRKICIGYDSRRFSQLFAQEAANVCLANGIKVILFDEMAPVPMLAYSIKYYKACAGIMITASHNPAEYNGLKAYWSDSSQVTSPIDSKIIDEYNRITKWSEIISDKPQSLEVTYTDETFKKDYAQMIAAHVCRKDLVKSHGQDLKIVYTPLHGAGSKFVPEIAKQIGFTSFHVVPEQAAPDINFSTVKVPNPEYPETLELATKLMSSIGADLVVASDPDTDRLGIAFQHNGVISFLTGNQIGVLLLEYKLKALKDQNQLPSDALVIKTIVTTELQTKIANEYNVRIENTLTGFKWMGKKIRQLKNRGEEFTFIFGNEESFGYLAHDHIADKDGVNALILMCECTLYYKRQGKSLADALDDIYKQYGYYQESLLCLNYPGRQGKQIMAQIMEQFRAKQTETLLDFKIKSKVDLLDHPDFPKSNVLGLHFENGHILWMRPSGTEPKIKFYTMYIPSDKDSRHINEGQKFITQIENELARLSGDLL